MTTLTRPSDSLESLSVFQEPELPASHPVPWTTPLISCRIQAGFPSPATEYEETELDANDYLIHKKNSTYFFTVVGDSMKDAGILDGDKVAIDRSIEPKHRHIVLAVVNNEFTLKRLYRRAGVVELRPENPAFKPIRFTEGDELRIWGVVTGVMRRLAV